MKVVKNNPVPAPVPPVTYTISDISEDQMKALRSVCSRCGSTDALINGPLDALYMTGFSSLIIRAVPH